MAGINHHKNLSLLAHPPTDGAEVIIDLVVREMFLAPVFIAGFQIGIVGNPALVEPIDLVSMHIAHLLPVSRIMDIHDVSLIARPCQLLESLDNGRLRGLLINERCHLPKARRPQHVLHISHILISVYLRPFLIGLHAESDDERTLRLRSNLKGTDEAKEEADEMSHKREVDYWEGLYS